MTNEQKEQLREVLIDYLQLLTTIPLPYAMDSKIHNQRIAEVRLLLREVA
jgi:hypothetical protein